MIENSDERGGLEMYCKMRKLCGKSVRMPRFYFTGRSGIIASNEDERL